MQPGFIHSHLGPTSIGFSVPALSEPMEFPQITMYCPSASSSLKKNLHCPMENMQFKQQNNRAFPTCKQKLNSNVLNSSFTSRFLIIVCTLHIFITIYYKHAPFWEEIRNIVSIIHLIYKYLIFIPSSCLEFGGKILLEDYGETDKVILKT